MAGVLATRDPGYVLSVPGRCDRCGRLRAVMPPPGGVRSPPVTRRGPRRSWATALALWRGDALSDCCGGGWAASEAVRLDELRLSTVEDRIDADLHARAPRRARERAGVVGGPAPAARATVGRVDAGAVPLRAGRRMRCAPTSGAREVLVGELGLEPGAELRRIEAAVLAGDPTLDAPDAIGAADADHPRRPRDPAPEPGRWRRRRRCSWGGRPERDRLHRALKAVAAGERRVVLISGEPGIGKTSLSAAFAREAFEQRRSRVVRALRRGPRDPVPAVDRGARPPRRSRARRMCSRSTSMPGAPCWRGSRRSSLAAADRSRPVERRRVRAAPALRCGRRPAGSHLGDGAARARARRSALGGPPDGPAPAPRRVGGRSASAARDRRRSATPTSGPITRSPRRSRAAPGAGASTGSRCAASATTSSSPCSRRRPATRLAEEGVALRDALSAETDGNPFFVGEMVRHLVETRALYQDEHGRWVSSPDLRSSGLPISIREVIGRRVRAWACRRGALSLAAVIGRDFDAERARPGHRARRRHPHRPVRPSRRRGGAHRIRPWRAATPSRTR